MLSAQPELIWRGRIHLGDEPGVYGDACYSGLSAQLPITLVKTNPAGTDTATLVIRTADVQTFGGYPGHLVNVIIYQEDPGNPFHWNQTVIATERIASGDNNRKEVSIDLAAYVSPYFLSVRLRVDTEVPPGLYDDFVFTRLENTSPGFTFVASLGFRA